MALTTKIAAGLFALYGVVSLVGGIIGYVATSSRAEGPSYASLIAGGVSGLLLLGCAAGTLKKPSPALWGGAVVSFALLAFFVWKLVSATEPPARAFAMAGGGLVTLAAAMVALGKRGGLSGGC